MLIEVKQLLQELPSDGSRRLFELWEKINVPRSARDKPRTPLDQLRDLLIRLSEHWESYCIFDCSRMYPGLITHRNWSSDG